MNDKEMLELAAKAAGEDAEHGIHELGYDSMWIGAYEWNPLIDDGDALRLAVKLGLQVFTNNDDRWGNKLNIVIVKPTGGYLKTLCEEEYGDDKYAAVRRAITEAAAEIGKGMK